MQETARLRQHRKNTGDTYRMREAARKRQSREREALFDISNHINQHIDAEVQPMPAFCSRNFVCLIGPFTLDRLQKSKISTRIRDRIKEE